jgi:hypothetical protein
MVARCGTTSLPPFEGKGAEKGRIGAAHRAPQSWRQKVGLTAMAHLDRNFRAAQRELGGYVRRP